jgi:nucleoside-diphosphate-sugar epimerase
MISNVDELEELLSRPSEADVEAVRKYGGDLMILGVGGKMGPTLAMRARRAMDEAGVRGRVYGVARFTDLDVRDRLAAAGVECMQADLLDRAQVESLPECEHVIHAAGRKFGSASDPALTWAMNVLVPAHVCERFWRSKIVAFSSGNVYAFSRHGASERDTPVPVGEYAWTGLGRERMFEYHARRQQTQVALLRLNYAQDLRYGVLLEIGTKVFERKPVDLTMGAVNVIWQGDANSVALRAFPLAASPAAVLNLAGPETLGVRAIAKAFGRHWGVTPEFTGVEAEDALLNDASQCHRIFGYPSVTPDQMIEWLARWIGMGGATHNKPTGFMTRDGKF